MEDSSSYLRPERGRDGFWWGFGGRQGEKLRGCPIAQVSDNVWDSHEILASHALLFLYHTTSPKAKSDAQSPRSGMNRKAGFHPAGQDFTIVGLPMPHCWRCATWRGRRVKVGVVC